jgi:hypothetical protein
MYDYATRFVYAVTNLSALKSWERSGTEQESRDREKEGHEEVTGKKLRDHERDQVDQMKNPTSLVNALYT